MKLAQFISLTYQRSRLSFAPSAVLIFPLLLTLSACGSIKRINESPKQAQKDYDAVTAQANAQRNAARGPIKKLDAPWVSTKPITPLQSRQSKIPPERDCSMRLVIDAPLSLAEFTQMVTADCHLPVRVTQDAWAALSGASLGSAISGTGGSRTGFSANGPLPPELMAGAPTTNASLRSFAYTTAGGDTIQPIKWLNKPLSGLLDVVTSQLGLSWSYLGGAVVLHYVDTRTFRVVLPSDMDFQSNVQSGSSLSESAGGMGGAMGTSGAGSSTTGETNQKTTVSIKAEFDKEMRAAIESRMTPGLGRYALSPTSGQLTVTDTPDVLARIEEYVTGVNDRMRRQVMLYVTVATVEISDSDSFGINWSAVWNSISGNYGFKAVNVFSPLEGASTAGFNILDTATGGARRFAGTHAILSALSKQGTVSIHRQRGVTTTHRMPTPIHLTRQQQYICGRSQTSTAQVGSTSSTQLCTVLTGFFLDMLPDIDGDAVTLQFSLNMSPPARIIPVPGDDKLPTYTADVEQQGFAQRTDLRSGQTLVLSDFQETSDTTGKQGLGDWSSWALTGGGTRQGSRRVVVVIITPEILPPRHSQS